MKAKEKLQKRKIRHKKVRASIRGTKIVPRLVVFRSNKFISLQLIDDTSGTSLLQMSDVKIKTLKKNKTESAHELGKIFAKEAKNKHVKAVVFDRGGYAYHGRVKSAAEGVRAGGLKF